MLKLVKDQVITTPGQKVVIPIFENDDAEGLSLVSLTSPSNGWLSVNPDTTLTYHPLDGFAGLDRFSYGARDAAGGFAEAEVCVQVTTPPVPLDDHVTTTTDRPVQIEPLRNDSDADGDPLVLAGFDLPQHGTLQLTGDNRLTYQPRPGFVGADQFSYDVSDQRGHVESAVVRITVGEPPAGPVVRNDFVETFEGQAVLIDVLANDDTESGSDLSIVSVSVPAHGSLALGPAQTLLYQPATGFVGLDRFSYTARRDAGPSADGEVEVLVRSASLSPAPTTLREAAPTGVRVMYALPNSTEAQAIAAYAGEVDAMTFENAAKPTQVFFNPIDFTDKSYAYVPDWSRLDALLTAGAANGLSAFRIHTPFWPTNAAESLDFAQAATLADLERRVETVLDAYISRFGNAADLLSIDIVNELVDGSLAASANSQIRMGELPQRYIALGADPDTYWHHVVRHVAGGLPRLALNDFNTQGDAGYQARSRYKYQQLLKDALSAGLPITRFGNQSHLLDGMIYSEETIGLWCLWLESHGIRPLITELDHQGSDTQHQDDIFTVANAHLRWSNCDEIGVWTGVGSRVSVFADGGTTRTPLYEPLFDALAAASPPGSRNLPTICPVDLRFTSGFVGEFSGGSLTINNQGLRVWNDGTRVRFPWSALGGKSDEWTLECHAERSSSAPLDGGVLLKLGSSDGAAGVELVYVAEADMIGLRAVFDGVGPVSTVVANGSLPPVGTPFGMKLARSGLTLSLSVAGFEAVQTTAGALPATRDVFVTTDEQGLRRSNMIVRWMGVHQEAHKASDLARYLFR